MRLIDACRAVSAVSWAAALAGVVLCVHGRAQAGPDMNGDGTPDHVWVDQRGASGELSGVRLVALSGVDGSELWGVATLGGGVAGDVMLIGDVTGDGVGDVVVAEPGAEVGGGRRGRVTVHSGANGAAHRTYTGEPGEICGVYVRPLSAAGGGVTAAAVGSAPALGGGGGTVRVLDLAGGVELCRSVMLVAPHDAAGRPIVVRGDVNGDAAVDWVDLDAVMARLGDQACTLDNADVNADGVIDSGDAEAVMAGMDQPPAQAEGTAVFVSLPQLRAWRARFGVIAAQERSVCRVIQYRAPRRTGGTGLRLVGEQEVDTDGDLIPDWHEWLIGTDPTSGDADQDGLSDAGELLAGTDPDYGDSDGDWLIDGLEYRLGTSPVACDTDGDGVDDRTELVSGARPKDPSDLGVPPAGAGAPVGDVTVVLGQQDAPDLADVAPWLSEPGAVVTVIEAVPGALFEDCQTDEHGTIGLCDGGGPSDVLGAIRSAGQRVLGSGTLSADSGGFTAGPNAGPGTPVVVQTFRLDLSVDSDNTNKDVPDCNAGPGPRQASDSSYDDAIEDLEQLPDGRPNPGKVMLAAFGDDDSDLILDFADGFGAFGDLTTRDDTSGAGDNLVSVDLRITGPVLPDVDTVMISYPLSHPSTLRIINTYPGHEPGPGALRLWVNPMSVDGGSTFTRDPRYVHEHADGELVPSGAWMKLDALRGASGGGSTYALFAEGVAVSRATGEVRIEATLALGQRPNDGIARVVEQGTDAVRLTITDIKFELASLVEPPAEYEWEVSAGVIVTGLEALDDLELVLGGEWFRVPDRALVQRVIIEDPRDDLRPAAPPGVTPPIVAPPPQIAAEAPPVLRIGEAELPLSREMLNGRLVWITQPFIPVERLPDPATMSEPSPVQLIAVGLSAQTPCGMSLEVEYNPRERVPSSCLPKVSSFDSVITDLVGQVVSDAMDNNWRPVNPANDGEFGSYVHSQCTQRINQMYGVNVSRRIYADVYVHSQTKQILSIGQFNAPIPGVNANDLIQIDVMRLKNAKNLTVGSILDTSNVEKYYDITTGRDKSKQVTNGLVLDDFRRVRNTMGRYPAIVPSTYRWASGGFQHLVPVHQASVLSERLGRVFTRVKRVVQRIPVIGDIVGAGMAVFVGTLTAEAFFETKISLSIVRYYNTREPTERMLLMADVAHEVADYLNESTGGLIHDLMSLVALYKSLGEPLPA